MSKRAFDIFSVVVTNTLAGLLVINFVLALIPAPDIDTMRGYSMSTYEGLRHIPYLQWTRTSPEGVANIHQKIVVVGSEKILTSSLAASLRSPIFGFQTVALPYSSAFDSTLYLAIQMQRGEIPARVVYLDSSYPVEPGPFEALRDAWERSQFSDSVIPLPSALGMFRWMNGIRDERAQRLLNQRIETRYPGFPEQVQTSRLQNWDDIGKLRAALSKAYAVPYVSIWARCGRLTGMPPQTHRTFEDVCTNANLFASFLSNESLPRPQ